MTDRAKDLEDSQKAREKAEKEKREREMMALANTQRLAKEKKENARLASNTA